MVNHLMVVNGSKFTVLNLTFSISYQFCRKICKMFFKKYHNNFLKSTEDVTCYKCIFSNNQFNGHLSRDLSSTACF